MAADLGREPRLRGAEPGAGCASQRAQVLRPGDAAVPVRDAAHRPRTGVHARRRAGPLLPAHRFRGLEADGLRLLRAASGECCAEGGRASSRHRRAEHRVDPPDDEAARLGDRLVTRVLHPSAGVLPLDAVALPEVLRGGSHVPEGCAGQLVPQRPDGAGERTGQERPLRALRLRGRSAQARPVVLPHHRLRRQPDRRDEGPGLAGARPGDAAQLDRPLRRRGDPVPR